MNFTKPPPKQFNKMDRQIPITIIGSLQRRLNAISSQLDFLIQQFTLFDYFNEPELLRDDSGESEINEITVSSQTRKGKSKPEDNLEGLSARINDDFSHISTIFSSLLLF